MRGRERRQIKDSNIFNTVHTSDPRPWPTPLLCPPTTHVTPTWSHQRNASHHGQHPHLAHATTTTILPSQRKYTHAGRVAATVGDKILAILARPSISSRPSHPPAYAHLYKCEAQSEKTRFSPACSYVWLDFHITSSVKDLHHGRGTVAVAGGHGVMQQKRRVWGWRGDGHLRPHDPHHPSSDRRRHLSVSQSMECVSHPEQNRTEQNRTERSLLSIKRTRTTHSIVAVNVECWQVGRRELFGCAHVSRTVEVRKAYTTSASA